MLLRLQPHRIARISTLVLIGLLVYLAALPALPRIPGISANQVSQGALTVAAHFATYFFLATLLF